MAVVGALKIFAKLDKKHQKWMLPSRALMMDGWMDNINMNKGKTKLLSPERWA